MAVTVYILVITEPGATKGVFNAISKADNVIEAREVLGSYDIVAKIDAPSLTDVPLILSSQIRTIEGIQSTTSLVSFPQEE